jgi:MFS family permease
MAWAAALAAPLYVGFGRLSDRIGRKKILLLGYALSLVLIFPLFHMMADGRNPALARATAASARSGSNCPPIATSACSQSRRLIVPRP